VGAEDFGEQSVIGLDVVVGAGQVVLDVAEERQDLLLALADVVEEGEPPQRLRQGVGRPPELEHLTLEPIDRAGVQAGVLAKDLMLDLGEVLGDIAVDDLVVVHDAVHHRVQDGQRAQAQLRGV